MGRARKTNEYPIRSILCKWQRTTNNVDA